VQSLVDLRDLNGAADLLATIWALPAGQLPIAPALLRALEHSGNYVAGAYVDGALVGVSAAWLGRRGDELILHSHITGIAPESQGAHIGYTLKQHQREWALARDVATIEWTFDPLIRRNAYFNLARLGATIVAFEEDLYGPMDDAMNAGEATDRAMVRWDLRAPTAPLVDASHAPVILSADAAGSPVRAEGDADVVRAWIPENYVRDRAQLGGWRAAFRETVGAAIGRGYEAVTMTRDGWYTLIRPKP
jgi:predicted GNAT superfamily acetyltransferase